MEAILPGTMTVVELKEQLAKRNLPVTGKKGELVDRLKEKLKELLKLHSLPVSGTKEEMTARLSEFLKSPTSKSGASGGGSDMPAAMLAEEPEKDGLVQFELTSTFDPHSLTLAELKTISKKLGVSNQGRKQEVLDRIINGVLEDGTVKQMQAVLKHHSLPSGGNKAELKQALLTLWSKPSATTEALIDINTAAANNLLSIAGNDAALADVIVANRPYSDVGDLKGRVKGLTAEALKANLHLLTGWIPKPAVTSPAKTPSKKQATPEVAPTPTSFSGTFDEVIAANAAAAALRLKSKQVKIASWNIRNISQKKTDEKLQLILQIITLFDFIAIQEVRDRVVIERMLTILGKDWSASVSDLVGTEHHKEHYGFLWRTAFVTVLTPPELLHDQQDDFVREPYIGYFRAGKFDFILATIHVVWGDSIVGRREEIKKLDALLGAIQRRAASEKDIIIVGDFNMPPVDMSWGIDGWKPLMNPPQKTVVGDTSLYDNIWLSEKDTFASEYTGTCGCIEFDKTQYDDSITGRRKAMSEISDHRPIFGVFSTAKDDDADVSIQLKSLSL